MSRVRITTAWARESGENPWLVSAYDEFTEDEWNGIPDFFDKEIRKISGEVRIVNLLVDYDAIAALFEQPALVAEVEVAR